MNVRLIGLNTPRVVSFSALEKCLMIVGMTLSRLQHDLF